jgi:hypothetical protein
MGEVAGDLALIVEEDDFGRPAIYARVLEHEAVDADEEPHRLEVELGVRFEAGSEVAAKVLLADDLPAGFPGQHGDERGGHLDIVGVMTQDAIEVVSVPGGVPLTGELLGCHAVHRTSLR